MQLAVTIKRDENIEQIRPLIEAVRKALTAENVTVLEAPQDLQYPYSFPVVTVTEGSSKERHFGDDAVQLLQSLTR
jgi:hypothetical protein